MDARLRFEAGHQVLEVIDMDSQGLDPARRAFVGGGGGGGGGGDGRKGQPRLSCPGLVTMGFNAGGCE